MCLLNHCLSPFHNIHKYTWITDTVLLVHSKLVHFWKACFTNHPNSILWRNKITLPHSISCLPFIYTATTSIPTLSTPNHECCGNFPNGLPSSWGSFHRLPFIIFLIHSKVTKFPLKIFDCLFTACRIKTKPFSLKIWLPTISPNLSPAAPQGWILNATYIGLVSDHRAPF